MELPTDFRTCGNLASVFMSSMHFDWSYLVISLSILIGIPSTFASKPFISPRIGILWPDAYLSRIDVVEISLFGITSVSGTTEYSAPVSTRHFDIFHPFVAFLHGRGLT